jgi:hypothetical protein
LTDQIDKSVEDDAMAVREQTESWIDSESEEHERWDEDEPELAPRPRNKWLRPVPLALLAVVIAAAGFLGGIEAQKGSESGSGAGALGGGLPSFAGKGGGEAATGEAAAAGGLTAAAGGAPSSGASEAAASGTVTSVEGQTIYVKETDGTTVAVKVGDGATVTRDSNVAASKVHPGDAVTVEGSKHGSTVRASSISATESSVESTSTSVKSLFEE